MYQDFALDQDDNCYCGAADIANRVASKFFAEEIDTDNTTNSFSFFLNPKVSLLQQAEIPLISMEELHTVVLYTRFYSAPRLGGIPYVFSLVSSYLLVLFNSSISLSHFPRH